MDFHPYVWAARPWKLKSHDSCRTVMLKEAKDPSKPAPLVGRQQEFSLHSPSCLVVMMERLVGISICSTCDYEGIGKNLL